MVWQGRRWTVSGCSFCRDVSTPPLCTLPPHTLKAPTTSPRSLPRRRARPCERCFLCRLVVSGPALTLHVAADGFLRNMVRALVGTLLWVGEGKLTPAAIPALLAAKDRRRMGPNVPPHGLYFAEAGYKPWAGFDPDCISDG